MSTKDALLDEIERFLALSGMSVTQFGVEAAGERGIIKRLKAGGDVSTDKLDRIQSYIREWRPARPRRRAQYQPAA